MPLEIWLSPLTHRICIGHVRRGKVLDKQDITAQCVNGAIAHLVQTDNRDVLVTIEEGKPRYRVVISEEKR